MNLLRIFAKIIDQSVLYTLQCVRSETVVISCELVICLKTALHKIHITFSLLPQGHAQVAIRGI